MQVAESGGLITRSVRSSVPTSVDTVSSLTIFRSDEARQQWQWQRLIADLNDWLVRPVQIDDEYTPPSRDTIGLALTLARRLANAREPAPNRVVTDANGGIVFESRENNVFESIRVSAELSIEYCKFVDGKLVRREPWQID